jgi:hypothetical protein
MTSPIPKSPNPASTAASGPIAAKLSDQIAVTATAPASANLTLTITPPLATSPVAQSASESQPPMDPRQEDGLRGDYIGGVYGTGISALALVALGFTWWAAHSGERRARAYQVFAEMMRTHEEIITSLELREARGSETLRGREAISDILSEFHCAYAIVSANATTAPSGALTVDEKIDIAYTFTFLGAQMVAIPPLSHYGEAFVLHISGLLSAERRTNRKATHWFRGHQNRLSHYFRNLYGAFRFIEGSHLSKRDKASLGKALRTKLSNYEQALLALNAISHLGQAWESSGLLDKYAPIKNIPKKFFTFDPAFVLHERFQDIEYEWQDMSSEKSRVWATRFGRFSLTLHRYSGDA